MQRDKYYTIALVLMRNDDELDQGEQNSNGEKGLDLRHILEKVIL